LKWYELAPDLSVGKVKDFHKAGLVSLKLETVLLILQHSMPGKNLPLRDPRTSKSELIFSNAETYPLLIAMDSLTLIFRFGTQAKIFSRLRSLKTM
jgi:hypothetical protein